METGESGSLYYPRVIWLKPEMPEEANQLVLKVLEGFTYTYKNLDVVLHVKELLDLRHTRTVFKYFQEINAITDDDRKTLCLITYSNENLLERDVTLSRVTRKITTCFTAYVNYDNEVYNRQVWNAFDYLLGSDKLLDNLSSIIVNG